MSDLRIRGVRPAPASELVPVELGSCGCGLPNPKSDVPRRRFVFNFGCAAAVAALIGRGNAAANGSQLGASGRPSIQEPVPLGSLETTLSSIEDVHAIVDELLASSFPELRNISITIDTHRRAPFYSFEARPANPFAALEHGGFLLMVNTSMFELGMPRSIAKAVIAHELSHGVWYRARGAHAGIDGGLSYVFDRESFEKATDLEAVRRGYGPGLAAHRRWLIETFGDQARARSKLYLTASEIERATQSPDDALWQIWAGEFAAPATREQVRHESRR